MDGGYLGLWSGSRSPDGDVPAVDFEIVGPDAVAAAAAFDRQAGTTLYDIPTHGVATFTALFSDLCREFNARLVQFQHQVPHRERVRRAIASGDEGFLITGVEVVAIGRMPKDRPLQVTATPAADYGWTRIDIRVSDEPVARVFEAGVIGVDSARFVFANADALGSWRHESSVDGLADVVFWGADQQQLAAELGVRPTSVPGEDVYGWLNLPRDQALARAEDLQRLRSGKYLFAFDFRPHSDHWRVMAAVRSSEHEAAVIDVDGATLMFAMTSTGDGMFPVRVAADASGVPVAISIAVIDEDD